MSFEFRLLDGSGNETFPLPDVESFSISPVFCDAGAIEFSYPKKGTNWDKIEGKDELSIALYVDGVRQPRLDALVQDTDGDDVKEDAVWKFTGFFNNGRLTEAVVYPKGWPSVNPQVTKVPFTTATAGTIVSTLMLQAKNRGALAGFTYASFSSTTDSNGVAWTRSATLEYAPGMDYLAVLRDLVDRGMCEFEMVGLDLRLYVPGTMSVDRTTQNPPMVFRRGRDLSDSPRKISSRGVTTAILAAGTEGVYVERTNAASIASRRRIESSVSQGQVNDTGTLTVYADDQLALTGTAKMEKTHGLVFGEAATPRPIRDFGVGDWAFSDVGKGTERLRIKQWVMKLDASGNLTGSVTLNDLFAERDEVLAKRLQAVLGGGSVVGASEAVTDVPANLVDHLAPKAPSGLVLTSDAYMDNQGQTFAQVSASWNAVTTNSDDTAISDLDIYRVRWRYSTSDPNSWNYITGPSASTVMFWSPVTPGVTIKASVQAIDNAGNPSAWSTEGSVVTGSDATPPESPSTPLVDNYMGLLRVRWDGKTASGAAIAGDQSYVEVHVSSTSGFTPSYGAASTLIDTLTIAGSAFEKPGYGIVRYAKLVAVDRSGNRSTPSAQASASTTQVVSADVFDGAIGTAKLADLAVTNAKIGLLAVNDANIGSLNVGKLIAGIMSADVTVSGRFTTRPGGTGQGTEMNAAGFQGWNASNVKTLDLNGVSNLLMGVFKTADVGRRIEIGSSGSGGEVDFYAPDGSLTKLVAFTASSGVEAIGMRIPSTFSTLWNSLQVQNDGLIFGASRTVKFVFGGGTSTQLFAVAYTPSKGTVAVPQWTGEMDRLIIDTTGSQFTYPNAGHFRVSQIDKDGVEQAKFAMFGDSGVTTDPGHYAFEWAHSAMQKAEFIQSTNVSVSTILALVHPHVAGYGLHMRYVADSTDGFTNRRIEFQDAAESNAYAPLWAAAFVVQSSEVGKTAIAPFQVAAMEKLRPLQLKKFKRKGPKHPTTGEPTPDGPEEFGVIAEELPEEMLQRDEKGKIFGVDLPRSLWLILAGLQETEARLAAIEQKGKP